MQVMKKISAENTEYITLTVNDDYGKYIEQKIQKQLTGTFLSC